MTSPTTTMRVGSHTRDLVNARARQFGQTADQVIQDGLRALERAERYRVMREEALALRDDPAELAEIAAIREDLHGAG